MNAQGAAALVVVSAVFHAGWNALLHRAGPKAREATLVVLIMSLVMSALGAVMTAPGALHHAYSSGWTWVSGISEGLYFITLGVVMQRLPLGLGYLVMRGLSMLLVTGLSVSFLGEEIGLYKGLGMAAIAAGVVLRGLGDALGRGTVSASGLRAAVGCAVGITGYHIAYGRALAAGSEALPLFAASLSIAVCINVAVLGRSAVARAWQVCRGRMVLMVAASVGCLGAFWLFLACLGALHAGVAICLRNLSVVFAQALAWRMGERVTPRAAVAVAFFVAGGALLVLAP